MVMCRFSPMSTTRSSPPSDADLARAAQRGEKRAFVEIVARHQAMVCGVALGVMHDFAASEDVAQEAFLTAWRKIQELREPDKLRSWLAQIARNAALGQLRRRKPLADFSEAEEIADTAALPDEVTAISEEARLVEGALGDLPEKYRMPLVLFYRQEQSVRAVADALQLSEDAVKQRLSRGREMLRARFSGVVESVLTRPRAATIFTMTIAAAIGALTAPAVIASGVFASAAATGAAATGSTAAPIATAMTTSKLFLTTAALVAAACLPLGYAVHFGTQSPSPPPAVPVVVAHAPKKLEPKFEGSEMFAEWRRLHDEHGNDAAAMPAIYAAIQSMKDDFRRRAFRAALFAEWAQLDGAGGFAFVADKDPALREQMFREWLARDPQAAVAGLLSSGDKKDRLAKTFITDIAKVAPEHVPALAALITPSETPYWDTEVRDAFATLAAKDLAGARAAAEAMTTGSREQALAGVACQWACSDFAAAAAWVKSLPDGVDRDEILRGALIGVASVNPAAALDQAGIVPPGGSDNHFAATTTARMLKVAAETDFDAAVAWASAHRDKLERDDWMGLAKAVTKRLNEDPAGFLSKHAGDNTLAALLPAIDSAMINGSIGQLSKMWDWLKAQPASTELDAFRSRLLHNAGGQDQALTMRIAAEMPPGVG